MRQLLDWRLQRWQNTANSQLYLDLLNTECMQIRMDSRSSSMGTSPSLHMSSAHAIHIEVNRILCTCSPQLLLLAIFCLGDLYIIRLQLRDFCASRTFTCHMQFTKFSLALTNRHLPVIPALYRSVKTSHPRGIMLYEDMPLHLLNEDGWKPRYGEWAIGQAMHTDFSGWPCTSPYAHLPVQHVQVSAESPALKPTPFSGNSEHCKMTFCFFTYCQPFPTCCHELTISTTYSPHMWIHRMLHRRIWITPILRPLLSDRSDSLRSRTIPGAVALDSPPVRLPL